MSLRTLHLGLFLASLFTPTMVSAQTAYPMLMSIEPVAVQIGKTSEVTVKSRYSMQDAYDIVVSGSGVRGEVIPPEPIASPDEKAKAKPLESLRIRLHIDPDALPGTRDLRVATSQAISTVGQIVLVHDPVAYETSDNDKLESAQKVELPIVVCGRIEKAEDVDFFQFHVTEGTTLCFHTLCMRLQDRIHDLQTHADPIIAIRDANGSIVAASDNELSGDPLICHTFTREGDYWLEIRDVRFQGNNYWEYCVEINDRPVITTTFPLGIATKTKTAVELIGYGVPSDFFQEVTLDTATLHEVQTIAITPATSVTYPVRIIPTELPLTTESEQENENVERAQAFAAPGGINGRIGSEGDVDCFAFDAKKGETYSFQVFARRAGSSLDSHLRLLNDKGVQMQLSDDLRLGKRNYADSWIENWSVPADGRYILEIRDLHLRGGPSYVYFLEATRSTPYFSLFADTDKTPLTPGTTGVVFVRAEKKNGFDSEIQLTVTGLPEGLKAHCGRILPGKHLDGCIVFEATADLKPQVGTITIGGIATQTTPANETTPGEQKEIRAVATVYQEIYQPGGGRGHWPVDQHIFAVTEPGDIRKVNVSRDKVVIKPGESQTIDIEIERAPGFDKNVTLEVTYSHLNSIFGSSLPEGVTVDAKASNTLLTAGATKGKITLKADAKAALVKDQQIAVMANVSLNFVMKASYSSKPILISVE